MTKKELIRCIESAIKHALNSQEDLWHEPTKMCLHSYYTGLEQAYKSCLRNLKEVQE